VAFPVDGEPVHVGGGRAGGGWWWWTLTGASKSGNVGAERVTLRGRPPLLAGSSAGSRACAVI